MYPFTRKDAGARCFDTSHQPFILAQETAWKVNRSQKVVCMWPQKCRKSFDVEPAYSKVLRLHTSTIDHHCNFFNIYTEIHSCFMAFPWNSSLHVFPASVFQSELIFLNCWHPIKFIPTCGYLWKAYKPQPERMFCRFRLDEVHRLDFDHQAQFPHLQRISYYWHDSGMHCHTNTYEHIWYHWLRSKYCLKRRKLTTSYAIMYVCISLHICMPKILPHTVYRVYLFWYLNKPVNIKPYHPVKHGLYCSFSCPSGCHTPHLLATACIANLLQLMEPGWIWSVNGMAMSGSSKECSFDGRNSCTSDSLSHYLLGVIHAMWCGISFINSETVVRKQQTSDDTVDTICRANT